MAVSTSNRFSNLNGVEEGVFLDSSDEEEDSSSTSGTNVQSEVEDETSNAPDNRRLINEMIADDGNWTTVKKKKRKQIIALPILAQREVILKAIHDHPVVVLCGSTGTGKTTQVPKYLYEAGYADKGTIGITEPRRIAATAMATRVAKEMRLGPEVSFHIRFWNTKNRYTKILFLTDGVLFKYFLSDRELSEFSVLIIDEAHERSVHSDTIIGLLTKLIKRPRRKDPLKIVIMSATLRVDDFVHERLFVERPIVIEIDARQYPINIYHSYKEFPNFVQAAHIKVCKIHQNLPPGGILVFLTTKREILGLCQDLKKHFKNDIQSYDDLEEEEDYSLSDSDSDSDYEEYHHNNAKEQYETIMSTIGEELYLSQTFATPLHILPLYSKLSIEEQQRIYEKVPKGARLCIISTNIAETSLTIPGIKYVVDGGKCLKYLYDDWSTTKMYCTNWISKAAAKQRAGRSGRESEGYCFRLYTINQYERMQEFTDPEISVEPIDDIVLQLKHLGENSISNFPFPSHPPKEKVDIVEKRLIKMGALERVEETPYEHFDYLGTITHLGSEMAKLPVFPQLSLILVKNVESRIIQYIIALVAALSVDELFTQNIEASNNALIDQWKEIKTSWTIREGYFKLGDFALQLRATIESLKANFNRSFCIQHGLRREGMKEINSIRNQLTKNLKILYPLDTLKINTELPFPTKEECIEIQNIFLSWLLPFGYLAKRSKTSGNFVCMGLEKSATIHNQSFLFHNCPSEYIAFYSPSQLYDKLRVNNVFMVDKKQIMEAGKDLIEKVQSDTPSYNKSNDQIVYRVTMKLGFIELKKRDKEIPVSEFLFRWFGYYLLTGAVFNDLKKIMPHINKDFEKMNPSVAQSDECLENFFKILIHSKISSKKDLLKIWETDKNFLFDEFSGLIVENKRPKLVNIWPPTK